MKRKWLRPENILLILPLLLRTLSYIHFISYGSIAPEDRFQLFEQRLWIMSIVEIFLWTVLLFMVWSMHLILRRKGLWKPVPGLIHLLFTMVLFSITVFFNDAAVSVVPGWHIPIYSSSYMGFFQQFDLPEVLLMFVQLVFTAYFTRQILRREL